MNRSFTCFVYHCFIIVASTSAKRTKKERKKTRKNNCSECACVMRRNVKRTYEHLKYVREKKKKTTKLNKQLYLIYYSSIEKKN